MNSQFKDDKMEYIEDDIQKIQMKTGMYISYVGSKGALHLCKEVIQNAIDECANPKSPAKNITIILDTLEDSLKVEDDGRGIPEDDISMEILCTKLNSGSKFTREQGGASSGENGVGNTAVNALSETFIWKSYRNKQVHRLTFKAGIKVKDEIKKSSKEHGCILKFIPSKKYLGKSAKISKKALKEWVESISYFLPDKCKIKLEIWNGTKLEESLKYKSKSISDLLISKSSDDKLSSPITLIGKTSLTEDFQGERNIKRQLEIETVFMYTNTLEPYVDSYCNYVNTTSGGVHLNSVSEALWRFLVKKTNESLSDKEKEKYKILKVDVEAGLNIIVNLFTDYQIQFVGQTKNEVSNDALVEPIKNIITDALEKYFDSNKSELTTLVKIVKTNCKARIDAAKLKGVKVKSVQNKFEEHLMDNFTPCNNSGKAYKELHICEGKSASGSLVDGRDPDTQAFLAFRGVVRNGFKATEATILENKEWAQYIKLIGTGFGPSFNLNKCNYDKIIIETDADVDGMGISSGICAFHALYLPELVKAGRLYKAVAPLYRLDDKNHEFVRDKREFVEVYENKIIKNFDIIIPSISDKELKKDDFKEFLYNTQEYSDELIRLAKHFGVNKFLIELVAYLVLSDKNYKEKIPVSYMEKIQKKFDEITLKGDHNLRGIIDGKFQSISINNRFVKKVGNLAEIFKIYSYIIKVKQKGEKKFTKMSIGEFLDIANKYQPKILARFKGLGEANSKDLWNTTLNPDTRMLIQLTLDDVEKDLKVLKKLHGQTKQDLEDRKVMMSDYKIKREDLDN